MGKMNRLLLELYPVTIQLDVPEGGFGARADLIVCSAHDLDCMSYPHAGIGRDYFTYRFRTESDAMVFRRRLETCGILEPLPEENEVRSVA